MYGGKTDVKNIANRARLGYIPVTLDEVPEMRLSAMRGDIELPGAAQEYSYKDVVIYGDLMLAKVPFVNVKQYREEVQEEAILRQSQVDRKAYQDGLNINESKTTYVKNGREYSQTGLSFAKD